MGVTNRLYTIALARERDLPALPAIELAAARLLVGQAPESVLTETTSHEELRDAQRLAHLWVALLDDQPVGFAHVKILETGHAHLAEIDVHPDHGRRGVGRQLVMAVCAWASGQRYESVTLTTFPKRRFQHAVLRKSWIRSYSRHHCQSGAAGHRER